MGPAPYPDLLAELPGVLLDNKDINLQVVTDDPESNFAELAAAALDNAGINAQDRLQAVQQRAKPTAGPALIEVANDKIVYEITFDVPNAGLAGLGGANVVPADHGGPPGGLAADTTVHDLATETVNFLTETDNTTRQYPTRLRRSVNRYSPQTTFLQLGEVQAHRSVVDARKHTEATREERMHATTWTGTTTKQDDTEHIIDDQLVTESEDALKI